MLCLRLRFPNCFLSSVGEAEIELQESVQKLHKEVEKAEEGTGAHVALWESHPKRAGAAQEEAGSENAILDLAAKDKESAIVRLTIEIEKELAALFEKKTLGAKPPRTISRKPAPLPKNLVAEPPTPKPDLCEIVPDKFQKLGERLAWFYGCIHRMPPSVAETKAAVAALSPDKREKLKGLDITNQEALIGVANGDLPIGVFPK